MASATEIIQAALKKIGALAAGETMSSEDGADALAELNRMLASWSADQITLHYRPHETFNLVAADGQYSIGASGDFDTARPNEIEQAFIRDSSGHDHQLAIRPISEYWSLEEKTSQTRPTRLYYDPTYPTGTIYFNTLPSEEEALHIISQKPLTSFATLATEASLPGEYESAIINRLAIMLAPFFGKSVSAELVAADALTYGAVKARNLANTMKSVRVHIPGHSVGTYNIDADG